jgi:ribosome-binding protein aMBF1 (putative translation factor)
VDVQSDIAERLRNAIQRDRRSLAALARASGVPYAVVQRLAVGERMNMTLSTAEKLAAALGLRLELKAKGKSE